MSGIDKCSNCFRKIVNYKDEKLKDWENFGCMIDEKHDVCLECLLEWNYDLRFFCRFCDGIKIESNILNENIDKIHYMIEQNIIFQYHVCECFL